MVQTGSGRSGRKHAGLAIRLALSLGLIALVVWWVDPRQLAGRLASVSAVGLAAVIGLHTGDRLLMAYKWRRLVLAKGLPIGLGESIRAYYVSSFAGVFLPMTVGADLVRLGALRRSTVSSSNLLASIAIERALGALSQAVFCGFSLAIIVALQLQEQVPVRTVGLLAGGVMLGLSLALPASFALADRVAGATRDRQGLVGKIGRLAGEYAEWRQYPREIWVFLLLTFAEGFFPILTYLTAAWALGVPATVVHMAAVVPIVYLLARMPVSVVGIGAEQASFAFFASLLLSMNEADAAAISFLVSPIALLLALLPGAGAWVMSRRDTVS